MWAFSLRHNSSSTCSYRTASCLTIVFDACFVHHHTRIDFFCRRRILILVIFMPVSVVTQQDSALKVWCHRNVGQPISAEAVHSVVNCCLCSAEWLQDFRPYYCPGQRAVPLKYPFVELLLCFRWWLESVFWWNRNICLWTKLWVTLLNLRCNLDMIIVTTHIVTTPLNSLSSIYNVDVKSQAAPSLYAF